MSEEKINLVFLPYVLFLGESFPTKHKHNLIKTLQHINIFISYNFSIFIARCVILWCLKVMRKLIIADEGEWQTFTMNVIGLIEFRAGAISRLYIKYGYVGPYNNRS